MIVQALEQKKDFIKSLSLEGTECFRLLTDFDLFRTENGWCGFASLKKPSQIHDPWSRWAAAFEEVMGEPLALIGGALKQESQSKALPLLFQNRDQAAVTWTQEWGLHYRLEFENVLNPGLFMDQRENRKILLHHLQRNPGPVLNFFSYTGAFSVIATSQGCSATSVDVSRRYLSWEKENQERNGTLSLSKRIPEDSRKYLARLAKRRNQIDFQPFSAIILDPPTFSKGDGLMFHVERDLLELVRGCLPLLSPTGVLLVSTNCAQWPADEFEDMITDVSQEFHCHLNAGAIPLDFQNESYPLKSQWILSSRSNST